MNSDLKNVVLLGGSVGLGLCLMWLGYCLACRRNKKKPYRGGVVSSLHVYPVKSCAGIDLTKMEVEKLGPAYDRHWVLINTKGMFLTQRQIPKMALITPSFEGKDYLCLDAPGMPTMKVNVDIDETNKEKKMLDVFGMSGEVIDCGDVIGQWFDTFLGKTGLRLCSGRNKNLKRRDLTETPLWNDVAKEGDQVMFPDVSPVMLLSKASLTSLNSRMEEVVCMNSFRPSVVVNGCGPYEEDSWEMLLIGDVLLRKLKQDTRCVLTTVDPETGTMRPSKEPLKTLKRVRMPLDRPKRLDDGPLFGVHYAVDQIGTINVGDEVIVLK